jgi:hypothetical protein
MILINTIFSAYFSVVPATLFYELQALVIIFFAVVVLLDRIYY